MSIILTSLPTLMFGQSTKEEIEESIKQEEMPEGAISAISEFWENLSTGAYYRETGGEMVTYEAKLDWQGYQYSIEFNESGRLLDIEQLVGFEELPKSIRDSVLTYLESEYTKHEITRVQRQFLANEKDEDNEDVIEDVLERDFEDLLILYELEVDAQNKKVLGSFELLFDDDGELVQKRRIVRRSLDNIW
ncbi:MAG: hypothetical protein R3283_11185 [Balneolaceae bacterium]|nr:hypothetical protein [Balneolaceae bacterium]